MPPRRIPDRTCVACRTVRQKRDLLRIVRSPLGTIVVDGSGRAAGRGAYICRATDCLDVAYRKGALSRALKSPLPPDLRARIEEILASDMTPIHEGGAHGQE